jgi:NAD(P)-dependent dehydrogenase (short-subunit alcohol dehydrogenase family)
MQPRTVQQLFNLAGKTALVTGDIHTLIQPSLLHYLLGGSRGLGLQMAHALGEAGARVIISSRKAEDLKLAAENLKKSGINCDWIAANCADAADIKRLGEESLAKTGSIDILVNNAGATWGAPAEDHPLDAWDKVMNLNVRGYFLLSQYIGKHSMIPKGSGKIINVASIAGLRGNPKGHNTIAYNTSKGAVINFTQTLAGEWGKYNITVNAICPGFFPTKMTKGTLENLGQSFIDHTPLQRLGDEEDLKGVTVLFASEAGKHVTGQWIAVDGGVTAI